MSPFTTVLLVACAALLVGTDARQHGHRTRSHSHLRNSNDATVALGDVSGSVNRPLPVIQVNGPDVILGLPDVCDDENRDLQGSLVVASNNDPAGQPAQLTANDADDAQSNFSINCATEDDGSRCSQGLSVTIYQFCSDVRTTTTTPSSTSSEGN